MLVLSLLPLAAHAQAAAPTTPVDWMTALAGSGVTGGVGMAILGAMMLAAKLGWKLPPITIGKAAPSLEEESSAAIQSDVTQFRKEVEALQVQLRQERAEALTALAKAREDHEARVRSLERRDGRKESRLRVIEGQMIRVELGIKELSDLAQQLMIRFIDSGLKKKGD